MRRRARNAVGWLLDRTPTADLGLPGLYFGEAGVALAIHEARRAGLVSDPNGAIGSVRAQLDGPLDWPDLTHGAAGQGIAALMC